MTDPRVVAAPRDASDEMDLVDIAVVALVHDDTCCQFKIRICDKAMQVESGNKILDNIWREIIPPDNGCALKMTMDGVVGGDDDASSLSIGSFILGDG